MSELAGQVKAIMADIFTVDASSLNGQSSMDNVESWDSLGQINLIAALEEEFDVIFDVEEFERMTCLADVLDALSNKI